MQRKLATWTAEDRLRRIDNLLRLISHPLWLKEAADITLSSRGANTSGVDGVTKSQIKEKLLDYLDILRTQLISGNYKPLPARRIYIPKANGKQRPLGIPALRDRIVQRAMLMAIEPIWENDFHSLSYGFRPERSVHHAIRTVKLQLTDCNETKGRWVIEGDLSSYFDTVHHRLLMQCVRKRIRCKQFNSLLWSFIKAGHVERNLFCATSMGVPQGGVISPILSNIMLNEFDQYLEIHYIGKKARKDRWYWNHSIKIGRKPAIENNRQWKPAVSYCRYADDFIIIVKGKKKDAVEIRQICQEFLEQKLKLRLNMEKTHITHINNGFNFLGHKIIRKRNSKGTMSVVSSIPKTKSNAFVHDLSELLSSNYSTSKIDMVEKLNQKLKGWSQFYRYTDFTAKVYGRIDYVVFWKLMHWLGRKYQCSIKSILKAIYQRQKDHTSKSIKLFGKTDNGNMCGIILFRLVGSPKLMFRWRLPDLNPYIRAEIRNTVTSRYRDVAMAVSHS